MSAAALSQPSPRPAPPVVARVARLDWTGIAAELDANGYALLPGLLTAAEASRLVTLYNAREHFRSRIVMARHGFGSGEYSYFAYPLPEPVGTLRSALYPGLRLIANCWNEALGVALRYPAEHAEFLRACHRDGQTKPTPLLLQYHAGDYNCLHQDLYGAHVFPLQATILLSRPGEDFSGGEFVLTEQRPRRQSRAEVVPLCQGDGVIFAVRHRPIRGARGFYRANLRHGVSRVRAGYRQTLGIIFHDGS